MILTPHQLNDYVSEIGSKTKNLKQLIDAGLNVPSFVAISSSIVEKVISKNGEIDRTILEKLSIEIQEKLPAGRYAVRSSALIEDSVENSFAGQFKTKINQSFQQLPGAIIEVLQHGQQFLDGSLKKFSLIIQEYIPASHAGICFTRNPLNGREMVIEYHQGIGEDIVCGKIKPTQKKLYWHQPEAYIDLPEFKTAFQAFKNIETVFKKPQDIEWCIKDGKWYFLQSRPITTITADDYENYIFLDEILPKNTHYFFEKTEISEIAERPTPFTLSLLEAIYAKNGPIHKVYSNLGVHYESKNFLEIIGNELYVNREKEIQTLLPSYSYFSKTDFKPHWSSFNGFLKTLKNFLALNKIPLKRYDNLLDSLKEKFTDSPTKKEYPKMIQKFLDEYEIIFEINVLAEKAIKKLEHAIKNEPVSIATILSSSKRIPLNFDAKTWRGNCLEIADESDFVQFLDGPRPNKEIDEWYKHLTEIKKNLFIPFIEDAQKFNILREYGRYLTVKNINLLRNTILYEAKEMSFAEPRLLYFATKAEIQNHTVSQDICAKRKSAYESYSKFHSPAKLTSMPTAFNNELLGVSKGKARGKLVNTDMISGSGNHILYTKLLTPDLTRHFDKIVGIVSESGGLLSHLAIMAREKGIPVIVNFDLAKTTITLGDIIEVDANQVKSKISITTSD